MARYLESLRPILCISNGNVRLGKLNSQFIVTTFSVLHAGGRSLFRFHIRYSVNKAQITGNNKPQITGNNKPQITGNAKPQNTATALQLADNTSMAARDIKLKY